MALFLSNFFFANIWQQLNNVKFSVYFFLNVEFFFNFILFLNFT